MVSLPFVVIYFILSGIVQLINNLIFFSLDVPREDFENSREFPRMKFQTLEESTGK